MLYKTTLLLLVCFYQLLSTQAFSQADKSSPDSLMTMDWLMQNFVFTAPDSNFVALGDGTGYTNKQLGATIRYTAFPHGFKEVKEDFLQNGLSESSVRLDTIAHKLAGRNAFTIINEELSPDTTKHGNYISVNTIVSFRSLTVCVVGVYPKTQDALLRRKFIKAALSVRAE